MVHYRQAHSYQLIFYSKHRLLLQSPFNLSVRLMHCVSYGSIGLILNRGAALLLDFPRQQRNVKHSEERDGSTDNGLPINDR